MYLHQRCGPRFTGPALATGGKSPGRSNWSVEAETTTGTRAGGGSLPAATATRASRDVLAVAATCTLCPRLATSATLYDWVRRTGAWAGSGARPYSPPIARLSACPPSARDCDAEDAKAAPSPMSVTGSARLDGRGAGSRCRGSQSALATLRRGAAPAPTPRGDCCGSCVASSAATSGDGATAAAMLRASASSALLRRPDVVALCAAAMAADGVEDICAWCLASMAGDEWG